MNFCSTIYLYTYLFISPWIKGVSTLCKNCKPLAIPVAMFPRVVQDNGFVPFYII